MASMLLLCNFVPLRISYSKELNSQKLPPILFKSSYYNVFEFYSHLRFYMYIYIKNICSIKASVMLYVTKIKPFRTFFDIKNHNLYIKLQSECTQLLL